MILYLAAFLIIFYFYSTIKTSMTSEMRFKHYIKYGRLYNLLLPSCTVDGLQRMFNWCQFTKPKLWTRIFTARNVGLLLSGWKFSHRSMKQVIMLNKNMVILSALTTTKLRNTSTSLSILWVYICFVHNICLLDCYVMSWSKQISRKICLLTFNICFGLFFIYFFIYCRYIALLLLYANKDYYYYFSMTTNYLLTF